MNIETKTTYQLIFSFIGRYANSRSSKVHDNYADMEQEYKQRVEDKRTTAPMSFIINTETIFRP